MLATGASGYPCGPSYVVGVDHGCLLFLITPETFPRRRAGARGREGRGSPQAPRRRVRAPAATACGEGKQELASRPPVVGENPRTADILAGGVRALLGLVSSSLRLCPQGLSSGWRRDGRRSRRGKRERQAG